MMTASSWMSDSSRTFLLFWTCCRIWSIEKFRSSGCVNWRFSVEPSCGLKLANPLFVVNLELFQLAEYAAPHGRFWLRPTVEARRPLLMLLAAPESELVGAWLCDCREKPVLNCGDQNERACAMPTSWICGSIRWI